MALFFCAGEAFGASRFGFPLLRRVPRVVVPEGVQCLPTAFASALGPFILGSRSRTCSYLPMNGKDRTPEIGWQSCRRFRWTRAFHQERSHSMRRKGLVLRVYSVTAELCVLPLTHHTIHNSKDAQRNPTMDNRRQTAYGAGQHSSLSTPSASAALYRRLPICC